MGLWPEAWAYINPKLRKATATWKRKLRNEGMKKIRSETELIHRKPKKEQKL